MNLNEIGKKEEFIISKLSKLYILEDGNILKLFKNPRDVSEIDRYRYMLNYDNDNFVFPFEFIYDNRKFYGYITRRVNGKTLGSVFSKSILLDLSTNSHRLEKNIDYVSDGGITLYDLHSENILYDGKNYSVIDHDENGLYRKPQDAKSDNRFYYRTVIGNLFINNIENNKHTRLIKENINKYIYMKMFPSEMIVKVKEEMEKYYKEKIDTIDDLHTILRR